MDDCSILVDDRFNSGGWPVQFWRMSGSILEDVRLNSGG